MEQETTKWGRWQDLYNIPGCRVKELIVGSGHSLSMQKHHERSEVWVIVRGACTISTKNGSGQATPDRVYKTHDLHVIPVGTWHKVRNPFSEACHIIEIQYGRDCREDDIELCPEDQEQRRLEYEKNNTI